MRLERDLGDRLADVTIIADHLRHVEACRQQLRAVSRGGGPDRVARECCRLRKPPRCNPPTGPGLPTAAIRRAGRGSPIVGHDRLDEILVVDRVVGCGMLHRLDSQDCFAPEHRRVPGDANLARPLDVRHPTIEGADELTERSHDAGRCRHSARCLVSHRTHVHSESISVIGGGRCARAHMPITPPVLGAKGCAVPNRRPAGSIPKHDAQERVVDLQAAVVLDEAQLPKPVHEEVHARAGGPHHLCQRFL